MKGTSRILDCLRRHWTDLFAVALFAISSLVSPSFELLTASLKMPTMAMITAGSLDGICGIQERTSSMTCHLSMCSSSLPTQMRLLTRTLRRLVVMHTVRILGNRDDFRDCLSSIPGMEKIDEIKIKNYV